MILGIEVLRDRRAGIVDISQRAYIEQLLERFNLRDVKPATTPLSSGIHLTQDDCPATDEEKEDMANVPYASLVGALMYAAIGTRPDIAFADSKNISYSNISISSHPAFTLRLPITPRSSDLTANSHHDRDLNEGEKDWLLIVRLQEELVGPIVPRDCTRIGSQSSAPGTFFQYYSSSVPTALPTSLGLIERRTMSAPLSSSPMCPLFSFLTRFHFLFTFPIPFPILSPLFSPISAPPIFCSSHFLPHTISRSQIRSRNPRRYSSAGMNDCRNGFGRLCG